MDRHLNKQRFLSLLLALSTAIFPSDPVNALPNSQTIATVTPEPSPTQTPYPCSGPGEFRVVGSCKEEGDVKGKNTCEATRDAEYQNCATDALNKARDNCANGCTNGKTGSTKGVCDAKGDCGCSGDANDPVHSTWTWQVNWDVTVCCKCPVGSVRKPPVKEVVAGGQEKIY